MDLCLDRIHHRRRVRRPHRSYRSKIPHLFPCCQQIQFRYLGWPLACLQPCCHGMRLVWCTIVDWRHLCLPDDPIDLAQLGQVCSRWTQELSARVIWHQHSRLRFFLPILAVLTSRIVVPCPQDPPPVRCQVDRCTCSWHCFLHLGYR